MSEYLLCCACWFSALGTSAEFRKNFEIPILRGRDADATQKDVDKGVQKLQEVSIGTHTTHIHHMPILCHNIHCMYSETSLIRHLCTVDVYTRIIVYS